MDTAPSSQATPPGPARCSGYVLLVEDDDALREEIAFLLESDGLTVRKSANAAEALAELAAEPSIVVVLSDVRMPGMSGVSLAREIRTTRTGRTAVEVVLLTGYLSMAEEAGAREVGAFGILTKPARVAHIISTVRGAMICANSRRMTAEAAR